MIFIHLEKYKKKNSDDFQDGAAAGITPSPHTLSQPEDPKIG